MRAAKKAINGPTGKISYFKTRDAAVASHTKQNSAPATGANAASPGPGHSNSTSAPPTAVVASCSAPTPAVSRPVALSLEQNPSVGHPPQNDILPRCSTSDNSSCSGSMDKYQNLERDKIELRVKQENFETEQRLEKERRALDEKQAAFEKERLVRLEEHHRLRAEVENVERLLEWRAGIRCDCCGFQGSSEADFLRHCRGKSHKRKGGSPPPVDGSTSTTYTSISLCASSASAPATGQRLKCVLCNVSVATSTELNEHLRGRRHRGTVARKAAKKEAAKVETDSNFISLTIDVEGLTSTTRRLLKNNVRSVSTAAATARRLGGTRGDRAAAADLAATARASASAVQVSFRLQERKRRAGARGEASQESKKAAPVPPREAE